MSINQQEIDQANITFWDELCGTGLAKSLGINDLSQASLQKFDNFYMDFYPYLDKYIPYQTLAQKSVLEIGLGYGTLSQKIIEADAKYHGLDIAAGPVSIVQRRLQYLQKQGEVKQGSILQAPFPDNTFDFIISIGCFHHTGNVQQSLDEAYRMLKPGGTCCVMIYYAYSHRRLTHWFKSTYQYFLWDKLKRGKESFQISNKERSAYDCNTEGHSAPETVFLSKSHMKRMTSQWSKKSFHLENIDNALPFFKLFSRNTLLTWLSPYCGLDLYCQFIK